MPQFTSASSMKKRMLAATAVIAGTAALIAAVPRLSHEFTEYRASVAVERSSEEKAERVRAARQLERKQAEERAALALQIKQVIVRNELMEAKRMLAKHGPQLGEHRQGIENMIDNRVLHADRKRLTNELNNLLTPDTYTRAQAKLLSLQQSGKFDAERIAELQKQVMAVEPDTYLRGLAENSGPNRTTSITKFIDDCKTCPTVVVQKAYGILTEDALRGIGVACSEAAMDLSAISNHLTTIDTNLTAAKQRNTTIEGVEGIDEDVFRCLSDARKSARNTTGFGTGRTLTGYKMGDDAKKRFDATYAMIGDLSVQGVKLAWKLRPQMDDAAFTAYALERVRQSDHAADFFEYLARSQGASRIELSSMAHELARKAAAQEDYHTALHFQLKAATFKNPVQ